ncbi:DUF1996 domain-containing protein [Streptomyces sp. NPDC003011]
MLGGGGLVAVNVYASATEGGDGEGQPSAQAPRAATVDCPDVGAELTTVPDEARVDVDKELAFLDQQIAEAYQRLQDPATAARFSSDDAVAEGITDPLGEERAATIERIAAAIDRVGDRPEGLDALAPCTLRKAENQDAGADGGQEQDEDAQGGQGQDGGQPGNGGQAGNGPVAGDYADITTVQPAAQSPQAQGGGSRGTFATSCGVNENGLFNSDNVIVAPGVSNGAHHFHDYVGNQSNDAFASDDDLANAETSCVDQDDKSSYFWPVLRLQNGTQEQDADAPGGGVEGNAGEIVTPKQATLTFVGNPRSKVTAMPRLLRIITGDAKAFVNGPANANASWSCTGFEDRQLKDKYPLCPQGSDVVRTFRFQSCWDGRNIDSANHRTHVAFAQADGSCPAGFQAIPQLVQRIVYDVDAPSLRDGGRTTPLFAVDSFPEQLHKPVTDHGDFINVFGDDLMGEMVDCINDGRRCDAGADGDGGAGGGAGGDTSGDQGSGPDEKPTQQPTEQPTPPASDAPGAGNGDAGSGGAGGEQTAQPPAATPSATASESDTPAEPAGGNPGGGNPIGDNPKADTSPSTAPTVSAASTEPEDQVEAQDIGEAVSSRAPTVGAVAQPSADSGTEPQAAGGNLAETGTQLWPAAAGAVLLICGFVLFLRTRRGSA